jgi:non-homologous end joining protein Ku
LGHAYHLVPSGKTGVEAFAVIHEAMKKMGMVAIDRLDASRHGPAYVCWAVARASSSCDDDD